MKKLDGSLLTRLRQWKSNNSNNKEENKDNKEKNVMTAAKFDPFGIDSDSD